MTQQIYVVARKREMKAISVLTYPSATKNSPFLSTATDVGLQNRVLPEPGTSLSPNTNRRWVLLPSGENLNTCNGKNISYWQAGSRFALNVFVISKNVLQGIVFQKVVGINMFFLK